MTDSRSPSTKPKFPLGRCVTTPAVRDAVPPEELRACFSRHQAGDWGDIEASDARANEDALKHGDRILSAFVTTGGRVYLITEADRSSTCALFPSEY